MGDIFEDQNFEGLQRLIESNVDVNDRNVEPLQSACLSGWERGVQTLLEAKANPNIQSRDGYTPIMATTWIPNSERILRMLLEAKADPRITNDDKENFLSMTVENKWKSGLQILVEMRPNMRDEAIAMCREYDWVKGLKLLT